MAAVDTADTVSDARAPELSGGGDAAFLATGAARLALDGILPATEDRPFEPAPWEIAEVDALTAADELPDMVFLVGEDAPADIVVDAPALAADIAMLVDADTDTPPDVVPAPWEAMAIATEDDGAVAAVADMDAVAEHWLDVFDADAAQDGVVPDHETDVAWFADDAPPADFTAAPESASVDVAALLEAFGHGEAAPDDPLNAASLDYLAAWPAGPPAGLETEPWPG